MKNKIFILITLSLFSFKCFALDNYYKMLGVPENASAEEIKKGYRRMATKYHPDKNAGSVVAGEIFKKVRGAYDVLSDPQKRLAFDKQLRMQPKAQPKPAPSNASATNNATNANKASNAQKHTWENFDQKPQPKEQTAQAKPEPKPEPKSEAKPDAKPEPKTEAKVEVKPTPEATGSEVKTASKVDTSVSNPLSEKTPVRNPKLDLYKTAPSCSKGFLGTVIDTLI